MFCFVADLIKINARSHSHGWEVFKGFGNEKRPVFRNALTEQKTMLATIIQAIPYALLLLLSVGKN